MPEPKRAPLLSRRATIVVVILVLAAWTSLARTWTDKGCRMGQSYALVVGHWQPDWNEGCEDEPGGPMYTDDYQRWG